MFLLSGGSYKITGCSSTALLISTARHMKPLSKINEFFGKALGSMGKGADASNSTASVSEILVIEDDDLTRKMIEYLLKRELDMKISCFSNGIEGLEYAEEHTPGLIISDIILPGKNGSEVLRKVRENKNLKHTKVVLVSAKSRSEDIEQGFALSADEYITKPFNPGEFTARIKKVLNQAA